MPSKINSLFLVVIVVALAIIPLASADNVNGIQNNPPFITIDPIGNHTIDEVFFINGTTNLPANNEPLLLEIETVNFNPAGWGSAYSSNVSIQPGENGVNLWSVNSTTSLWETFPGPEPDNVTPGGYSAAVQTLDPRLQLYTSQTFLVLPIVANPFITIDPITSHTIGDLINVTGTTNVPSGTVLSISAGPSTFTNYRPNFFMGQTTVMPGTGTNTWSTVVNTTDFITDQYHLTVAPVKEYALSNDTLFTITRGPTPIAHESMTPGISLTSKPVLVSFPTTQPTQPNPTTKQAPLSSLITVTGVSIVCSVTGKMKKRR